MEVGHKDLWEAILMECKAGGRLVVVSTFKMRECVALHECICRE